jgi:hypothetical protein
MLRQGSNNRYSWDIDPVGHHGASKRHYRYGSK